MRDIHFDHDFNVHLANLGISVGAQGVFPVHEDTVLETPVTLFGADIWRMPARIGAFSYFGANTRFHSASAGRYCSFAPGLEVGLSQHPGDWLTSSPVSYVPNFMNFERHFADADLGWARELPLEPYDGSSHTEIGNDVWIGASVYLKDGITVGDGAIIGAHAVVTKDVPPYAIVVGTPARVVRYRFDDAMIARLLALRWWDYNILEFGGWHVSQVDGAVSALEDAVAAGIVQPYAPAPINLIEEYDRYRAIQRYLGRQRA